ncbi:putative alpha beta-hydrolase [Rosellinia necatrix]|uniref:Putative alpha beta-hydrolase n=1 Tax=Rosellinia necatrix TaxID=77044 RepID=A0A1W2TIN2_ROSNE|nr:putative alpha beta-hydrolase [Rosellinia necatrix]
MQRIRETLARLTRAGGRDSRDTLQGPRLDRVGRTSSSAGSSRERIIYSADNKGSCILHDGVQPGEEGVDIVFVHGLFGSRLSSYTKGGVCWIRDLLGQDIPNARIISWGWSSTLSSGDTFAGQAESLLGDISRARTHTRRPIIFVGHGLGGLLIKEALVIAALSRIYGAHAELGNVYPRTIGCIFLGTPHTRSGKRSLGDCVAATAVLAPSMPASSLLRGLRESNQLLETQHSTFLLVSRDIKVICIREKLPTTLAASIDTIQDANGVELGKGTMQTMVPKDSVAYDNFNVTKDELPTNHLDLCRYKSRDDAGYQQLISHIRKITSGPSQAEVVAQLPRNQDILNALHFDTMMEREERIDPAYGQTCEWMLSPKVSPFTAFLSSKDPILWISGKAGSGKSTLMKYAWKSEEMKKELLNGWAKGGDLIMARFFMFEGGNRIQKTYEGFLRSTLYQILSTRHDLIKVAFPSFFDCPWPPPVQFTSTTNLNQGFYSLFAHMSEKLRLVVFIDGIDEYRIMERKDHYEPGDIEVQYDKEEGDESWGRSKWRTDSHTEIADLIGSMANKDIVKFVVSSRELPIFEKKFAQYPRIKLHEHTEASIAEYIAGRLDDEAPGLPDTVNLCAELAQKSQGDILWARLALDMVIDGSLRTLRATLNSLPTRLGGTEGLYMRMIENLKPEDQNDACRIFHLVLRAQQPPSIITLAFADQGYLDPYRNELKVVQDGAKPFTKLTLQQLTDQMHRRLKICCVGLLEAEMKAAPDTVQTARRVVFNHQTTKEWVGRRDIWQRLPSIHQVEDIDLDLSLLSGCVRHLRAFETTQPPVLTWPNVRFRPDAWLIVANALRYAERIDGETKNIEMYAQLLDELDASNQRSWVGALNNLKPLVEDPDWYDRKLPELLRKHWAGFEPMEAGKSPKRKDFLSLVVQANLVRYVHYKLSQLDEVSRQKKAQELLVYAVCPKGDGFSACVSLSGDYLDFHHDMPDTRLLDVLYDAGADPRNDDQMWSRALKAGRHYFSRGSATMTHLMETYASKRLMLNRERWVAAVTSLLAHGANPHVELMVETPSSGEDDRSTRSMTIAAIDYIRETLEGEPEYAIDLLRLQEMMGRRPSVGLAR